MSDSFRWPSLGQSSAREELPAAALLVPRLVDERYLSMHPATALWHEQRPRCWRCKHHFTDGDGRGERCSRTVRRIGAAGAGRSLATYCIDSRAEGGACGPDAKLFEPK